MAESFNHPVFGNLRWFEKCSWWETRICLESGKWIEMIVDPGDDDPAAFVERAAELFRRAMDAERRILEEGIQNGLLDLYDAWRQEDEPNLTAEGLMGVLDLVFVRIDTVIPVTLAYGLGDVFGG
jgi:hypothetical protein